MNCEEFEPLFSDYIDGIMDRSFAAGLQGHLRCCPDCQETLSSMHQVRMALHSLGGTSSPASFKLRLSNRLQEELHRQRWAWMRPLAWGFAPGLRGWPSCCGPSQRPSLSSQIPIWRSEQGQHGLCPLQTASWGAPGPSNIPNWRAPNSYAHMRRSCF